MVAVGYCGYKDTVPDKTLGSPEPSSQLDSSFLSPVLAKILQSSAQVLIYKDIEYDRERSVP